MVLNVQHLTDWTVIKAHKQQIICKNTVNIWCMHPFKTPNSNRGGECSMCWAKDRQACVN
jgi:hypothetical protein